MPEGPEIRRAADIIEAAIVNKPTIEVSFTMEHLKSWEPRLTGATVKRIKTFGKAMLTQFDNGLNIYSHNQLYGRWYTTLYGELPATNRQLRLAIHTHDQSALLYSASQIEVLRDSEIATHPFLCKIGMDVFSAEISEKKILELLVSKRFRNRQLGAFLTDQTFVAGLGNYLRCEILFVVGLNPLIKPSQLTDQQLTVLAQSIIKLPRQSYETSGITNDLKQANTLIKKGQSFENSRFWIFRREGLNCYRCNDKIRSKNMGGQRCYYCPTCQK